MTPAPALVLGPALRHVGETNATLWVQTSRSCTVEVRGAHAPFAGCARTFEVSGHHYALVVVGGLEPDGRYPYEVRLDGTPVWPLPHSPFPPSEIRTRGPRGAGRARILFGSCRYVKLADRAAAARYGLDALDVYAARLATDRRAREDRWPTALLLLGDQVYADELTPQTQRRIGGRRDRHPAWPDDEIVGFDEYAGLYRDSWADPEVRWLLSTVPTAMIFDDHDVRDDWNTSAAWRAQMAGKPWWRERIRAALASYVVYQHLGNLTPDELQADPVYRRLLAAEGDAWPLLAGLADRADARTDGQQGVRFSFRWDLGCTRLVMIDSRNARVLDGGRRLMLDEEEFAWVDAQATDPGGAGVDHLLLGTSVPWLMPPAITDLQSANERAAARPGLRGRVAEAIRQAADLEHWPAFRESFDRLAGLVTRIATGPEPPATITVLSGDVHHSYAVRVDLPEVATRVHQLTCSPLHNHVPGVVRLGFRLGWSRGAAAVVRRWAARAGVPAPTFSWSELDRPLFGNHIASLLLDGRRAEVVFERPLSSARLEERARHTLQEVRT